MDNKSVSAKSAETVYSIPLLTLLTRTPHLTTEQWDSLNWFYRWLVMVRAVVLVMTISSVIVGIILAAGATSLPWDRVFALIIGLTMAHATNNLINDWTDKRMGIDQDNYFRRRYGTHALQDDLISNRAFWSVTLATGITALACGLYLITILGDRVFYLTLAGGFFVLFYTWPLKHYALGELAVLLVWGPLLTCGAFYVLTEAMTTEVLLISLIAGLGPTLVILGKHMDKIEQDLARSVKTLPVAIGLTASRRLTLYALAVQWLLLGYLVVLHDLYALLLCSVTITSVIPMTRILLDTPPDKRPDDYPEDVWPLYYSAYSFRYCRDFGFALIVGLLLQLFIT